MATTAIITDKKNEVKRNEVFRMLDYLKIDPNEMDAFVKKYTDRKNGREVFRVKGKKVLTFSLKPSCIDDKVIVVVDRHYLEQ
ncbi:hypothetical protein [Mangrovibacillus cuniculi]|uniref:Uncharacterized protein n=1 Tax=Mangrovibacillus cuniculi TaxID=2593652 RepID=A0A7S8CAQ3_9BACI|nr:hypothetical protein [Mangrovibacillus cuniculi]QPC46510.1 hypothetical protein G8O30_05785 [Mangrovibacillus cuniculi]